MIRKGIYSIQDVLSQRVSSCRVNNKSRKDFDGDLIKMNSQRYECFDKKGTKCVTCGIEGKFFAKERHKENKVFHFNLYAVDKSGNEVLMTKDHIIAKSKGGANHISNYQTMCTRCNHKKSDK
ncbi:HNH endonuclease [Bacillus thuringiensis]|uniref:HNH endonuclease n=1 Tax=Bacillus thuringiensis TaxID=1428 RepID=UPI003F5B34D9